MNRSFLKTVVFTILLSASIEAQWAEAGFNGRGMQDIAAKDTLLYALSYDNFYSSKDKGASWDSLSSFTAFRPQHILFLNDTIFVYANWAVVAETALEDRPCVFRSDDGGYSWKAVLSSFMGASSMTINGRTLFCIASSRLLKSTNYGATWDTLSLAPPAPAQVDYLFSHNEKLYAARYNGGILKSTDNGLSWKGITGIPQQLGYPLMLANSKYIFIEADSVLYRSSDDGESWDTLEIPLKPRLSVFNALATDSMIFLTGYARGMYTTKVYAGTISNNSWRDISAGLTEGITLSPNALALLDNWLFLAGSNELWKYDLSHLLAVEDNHAPVNNFRLSQNYPNPFNPATTISYSIPISSYVELKVFDMLGREVQTLVNIEQSAGFYKVQFSGAAIPSGMYIYRIRANEYTKSGKMLLLK